MNRIRVALFADRTQAEPLRLRLVLAGIPAEVQSEPAVAKLWFVSKRLAGVRLEIPAQQAAGAKRLLLEWKAEGLLSNAVCCPECRSLQVDYPQFTEKSLFTNLAMGLMAALGLVEKQFYCEECHCMWAKPESRQRRVRRHTAPDYFLEGLGPELSGQADRGTECRGGIARLGLRAPARSVARLQRAAQRGGSPGSARFIGGLLLLLGLPAALEASDPGVHSAMANLAKTGAIRDANQAAAPTNAQLSKESGVPTYLGDVQPILMGKCTRCHDPQSRVLVNLLDYPAAAAKRWEIKRRVWDSWQGTFFKQPMPTGNSPESQAITEAERLTIRNWVESGAPRGTPQAFASAHTKAERIQFGQKLFATICAACHQPSGQGIPGRFPPLAGSDFLNADKHRAIQIVVNGLQGEVTVRGQKFNSSMPRFPLSDEDIANALTYVYSSFGNSGQDVTPGEVRAVRAEKEEPVFAGHAPKASEEKSPFE